MTTARALLEMAFLERAERYGWDVMPEQIASVPSGAELLRRADEPRAAEGLTVEHREAITRYHIAQKGWEESVRAWSLAENLLADIDALPDNPPAVVAILQRYRDEYGDEGPGTERLSHIQRALDSATGTALPAPRPPEPDRTAALVDLAMQEALLDARTERDRLAVENERLRADLATFTEEPGVLARVGAEHTTYWYNQTRLLDARAAALMAALEDARKTIIVQHGGHYGCADGDCYVRDTLDRIAAILATPEPGPVADGTVALVEDVLRQASDRLTLLSVPRHASERHGGEWSQCSVSSCWLDRGVLGSIEAARALLDVTPEPAPVADGTVEG